MPSPMDYLSDPSLQNAQNEAQNAGTTAANYQSASALLPQKLKEAVMSKLDYNKDIIAQKNEAQAKYFAAPAVAREQYQNVWNPFEREKLVANERAQAYQPYATLSDILSQRMGTIADIINSGTGAFNADVSAKQSAAELARQRYADLLGIANSKATYAQNQTSALEKSKQQAFDNALALAKFNLDKAKEAKNKGSGGSGIGLDFLKTLEGLGLNIGGGSDPSAGTSTNFSEPQPKFIPTNSAVQYHSPRGEWTYNWNFKAWVPTGAEVTN